MNKPIVICAVLLTLATNGGSASGREPAWLQPCDDRAPGALCGTFEAREDRSARKGRRIELFMVVLPATGPGPHEAPIFPLAGGPGQAASGAARMADAMYGPLRTTRDIVLLDQRGTGRSNKLDCGTRPADAPLQDYLDDFPSERFARDCIARQTADVALYTTEMAVGDLEEVRKSLGYSRISLHGGSYGTRVALHYIRRHPKRVRSAVLDGVSPPHSGYQAQFAPALEVALSNLFERCESDSACSEEFPDLESDWAAALGRFADGPVEAIAKHPESGREEAVAFSRGVLADHVRRLLYDAGGWSRAARTIHAAAAGDFDALVKGRFFSQNSVMRDLSLGMLLTVSCTESVPFFQDEEIERITSGTSLGDHRVRTIRNACRGWRAGALPPDWSRPVKAEVPVLILSGAVDPATPQWVAAEVAAHLPNGLHVVIPNRSHGPTDWECENRVVQQFFAKGSSRGLDTDCLRTTSWPAFAVAPATTGPATTDPEVLARYVGSYELQPGFVLVVTLADGRLFIEPPGEARQELQPVSEDLFLATGIGEHVRFARDADGVVDRFKLENGPTARKVD